MECINRSHFTAEETEAQRTGVTQGVGGKDRISTLVLPTSLWTATTSKDWIPIIQQRPVAGGTPKVRASGPCLGSLAGVDLPLVPKDKHRLEV